MEYCKITLDYSPEPVWKFPPDHFVTYGKEDEEWAKGLNFMKSNHSQDYFINWCKLIVNYNKNT